MLSRIERRFLSDYEAFRNQCIGRDRHLGKYDGTSVVHKVWNGSSNLVEPEADGSAGHFEGLSVRLYNPQSHLRSLNFASSRAGPFSQPTISGFKNGRSEFFDQEH